MSTVTDLERQFLLMQLGVDGVGKTIDDLRYEFYQGVVNGTISLGGGSVDSTFDSQSNTWRAPLAQNNGGTGVQTAGQLVLAPVSFPETLWLSGMGFRVFTAGAGSTGAAALYEDTGDFFPGSLIQATSNLDTSATGAKSEQFTGFQVFPDRLYWAGVLTLGATPPSLEAAASMTNNGRLSWLTMPYGTAGAPAVNAGNDGQVAVQTGLAAPPANFAGSLATDKNSGKNVPWMVYRLVR